MPEAPLPGPQWEDPTHVRGRWMYTTFIELVVDGDIVDLNRIPLPADTPIVDERFKDEDKKASNAAADNAGIEAGASTQQPAASQLQRPTPK